MDPVEQREASAREIGYLRWPGEAPTGVTYYPTLDAADQQNKHIIYRVARGGDDTIMTDTEGKPIAFRYILDVQCSPRGTPRGVPKYQYHRLICRYAPGHGWMLVCMHCDSDDNSTVISMTPILLTDKAKNICH